MASDVRELPGARWASQGTRVLAGLYVWLCVWLVSWVLLPSLLLPWSPMVITSGSMGPFINPGDVVLSTTTGLDDVQAGQVVTFHRDGDPTEDLITHRLVFIDSDGRMTTRGDANAEPDSTLLTADDLVGRGRLLIPYAGLPLLWLRQSFPLFVAWAVLSSVAVHLARAGVPKLDGLVDDHGRKVLPTGSGLWAPLDRVLGIIEGEPKPAPGPVRAFAPTVATALALASFVRDGWAAVVSVVIVLAVLIADPRGPHLPVGRLVAAATNLRAAVTDRMLPRVRDQGVFSVLPLVAIATVALTSVPSGAAFTTTTSDGGSQFGSGIWACTAPGPTPTTIDGAAWVDESSPDAVMAGGTLRVEGDTPRARAFLEVDLTAPLGCAAADAVLTLPIVTNGGESLEVRAVTEAFDAGTLTWNSQPAVGGPAVRVDADLGLQTVDVTSLVADDVTGFAVTVYREDSDGDPDDDDPSGIVQIWSLGTATPPTVVVDWAFP